ncbi:helix-turn-helix domain-containing protein [Mucilaginibacter pocheonensis]|uniref:Excisionase family DNA binding protein n=1 Tax=Mucilaginibacter pocheonensis TaxID=398050 RepID=A0ABU1T7M4_9SPHI|nr:helix-turn-helix domain-containing protein [Mucilaginibacter pocheonensis]MDR6941397.1 excisionase family DNA binding protein [Mucilaginibacter pocheonensis]
MEKLTFEQLPQAVSLLLEKVQRIEALLEGQQNPAIPEMMDVSEAADILKLSVAALYSKVCRGEIPYYKPGRRLYFKKDELVAWMSKTRRKPNFEIRQEAEEYLIKKRPARRWNR